MDKLGTKLSGGIKSQLEIAFFQIDSSMMNFCSWLSMNTIDSYQFGIELKEYFDYSNRNNKKTNNSYWVDVKSFGSFNHELKVRVSSEIYMVLDVHISLGSRKNWGYRYKSIVIADKWGEVIEDIN